MDSIILFPSGLLVTKCISSGEQDTQRVISVTTKEEKKKKQKFGETRLLRYWITDSLFENNKIDEKSVKSISLWTIT